MIPAEAFIDRLRRSGCASYTGVPCSYLTPLINRAIRDPELHYVPATNEGDAVAIAAGWALGGRRGVVMMQNSGLGNAVNPLTSLAWTFRIPMLLIVTLRGDPRRGDEPQHELMGRSTTALLELMEIPWRFFPSEIAAIDRAVDEAAEHLDRSGRPFALVMRRGDVEPVDLPAATPVLARAEVADVHEGPAIAGAARPTRAEALDRLLARTDPASDVLVATTGHTGRELWAHPDRPDRPDLLAMVGSMGCASALGLGLAQARPERRVIVIDGDGAVLMRMGNLALLGAARAANLVHLVLDNGVHASTGGQATVSPSVALAHVAAACGFAPCFAGDDAALVDRLLDAPGAGRPRFGHLRIRAGSPADLPRPDLAPEAVARRLTAHLHAGEVVPGGAGASS